MFSHNKKNKQQHFPKKPLFFFSGNASHKPRHTKKPLDLKTQQQKKTTKTRVPPKIRWQVLKELLLPCESQNDKPPTYKKNEKNINTEPHLDKPPNEVSKNKIPFQKQPKHTDNNQTPS